MDDAAWGAAVMGVVDRLSPALVTEVDRGKLSLDTAVQILQETTQGALTGAREFLEGCLSDLMDYRLDGTVPEAEPNQSETAEDPCPETTAETLSELAWSLVYAVEDRKLPLETAVFLYSMAADLHKNKAEEVISFVSVEYLTGQMEDAG
ncbi:hypothetical protein GCM10019016_073950 [Streptomyces prasinosporus]|uniref:Uncharacterized protein n=1 Tax=Streptomyces prasinosporus TaxID=68256 RepID=A0ABP6U020_9ACTN